jgi:hypothetical protein
MFKHSRIDRNTCDICGEMEICIILDEEVAFCKYCMEEAIILIDEEYHNRKL